MSCADFRDAMSAHVDGEDTERPGYRSDLDSHPARCADCAHWLAAVRRLKELARSARRVPAGWSLLPFEGLGRTP
ncbi:hypothetical protein ACH4E7_23225 [Kitasatospora sp. NPDC018058]|uniref:hypothetical protein n=1 Tax=Kitasatospora sp. NPDC018058 TaxID=3364025 RepID=UPI0037C1B0DE